MAFTHRKFLGLKMTQYKAFFIFSLMLTMVIVQADVSVFVPPSVVELEQQKQKQISYVYKTELVVGSEQGREIAEKLEDYAKNLYGYLNDSPYFKTSFVRNVKAVRQHHLDTSNPDKGRLISIDTKDGIEIKCTYFDRGSDELVIVGSGFTNEREIMTPFVEMFKNDITGKHKGKDVLLFDFRGHGYDPADICAPSTWFAVDLAKNTFGMDARHSKLGEVEDRDIVAVVNAMRAYKNYKHVYGVSVCYGSFIFLKAQAMHPGLFDKIVVDGCWDSLEKVMSKLRHDIKLLCKPQTGGWKDYWLSRQEWFQEMLFWCARHIWALNIDHDIFLTDYLPSIHKTPVLFFYGKNDLMVYRNEFEELWNALPTSYKVAVITSNPHVMNQYKQKELYKLMCETFFTSSSLDDFKKQLHTIES